jgi:hypothetical protein
LKIDEFGVIGHDHHVVKDRKTEACQQTSFLVRLSLKEVITMKKETAIIFVFLALQFNLTFLVDKFSILHPVRPNSPIFLGKTLGEWNHFLLHFIVHHQWAAHLNIP